MSISCAGLQVIQAADEAIGLVDKDALARHFAMKSEAEDQDAVVVLLALYNYVSSLTSCSSRIPYLTSSGAIERAYYFVLEPRLGLYQTPFIKVCGWSVEISFRDFFDSKCMIHLCWKSFAISSNCVESLYSNFSMRLLMQNKFMRTCSKLPQLLWRNLYQPLLYEFSSPRPSQLLYMNDFCKLRRFRIYH